MIGAPASIDTALTQFQSKLGQTTLSQAPDTVKKAAEDFEAMFLTQMLSHMFSGIEVNETFGGGKGEEIFRSFLVQEYGKIMTQSGGIGIANSVAQEMIKIQELSQ